MSSFNTHAVNSAAKIISAPAYSKAWNDNFYAERMDNPVQKIADEILDTQGDWSKNPALLGLVKEIFQNERAALPSKHELSAHLANVLAYLDNETPSIKIPPRRKWPQNYQKIADIAAKEHAQKSIPRLGGFLMGTLRHQIGDMMKTAKEHPAKFASLCAAVGGIGWFMNKNMAVNAYMDPKATAITNLNLDTILNLDSASLDVNPDFINVNAGPSCHDHLKQMFGEKAADTIKNTLDMGGFFPEHCSVVSTTATDVQNAAWGVFNFFGDKWQAVLGNSANAVARVLPDSSVKMAFIQGTEDAIPMIAAVDSIENAIVHIPLAAASYLSARKLATISNEEYQETKTSIQNFGYRLKEKSPLALYFSAAAASHNAIVNANISFDTMTAGLAAGGIGYGMHWLKRRWDSGARAGEIANTAKDELAAFADPAHIISNASVPNNYKATPRASWKNTFYKSVKLSLKGAFTISAASLATACAGMYGKLDKIENEAIRTTLTNVADTTAYAAGQAGSWFAGLVLNVPQDIALHGVFIAGFGTIGLTQGLSERGISAAARNAHRFYTRNNGRIMSRPDRPGF